MELSRDIEITPSDTDHSIDPATVIPQDVLYDVFLYLKPPISEIDWTSIFLGPQQPILRLGHVSRAWRSLVWSFPLLWDCLDIPFSRITEVPVIEEILEQFLGRSGDYPLHISLHTQMLWSEIIAGSMGRWGAVLNTLCKDAHRWRTLKFIGPGELLLTLNDGNHDLRLLTTAYCLSSSDRGREASRLTFLSKASNIRNLRLLNCDIEDNLFFPNLTRLECGDHPPQSIETLLDGANNLRHLELRNIPRVGCQSCISFPRLSVLRLAQGDEYSLARRLDTPMLRCLIVGLTDLPTLFQCIHTTLSTFRLHTLAISTASAQSDILYQILSITDSLVTFYLYHMKPSNVRLQWRTIPDMLNPDQPLKVKENGKKPKVILPNLENLYYRTDAPVRSTNLVEMIKRRWNGYQSAREYDGSGRPEGGWKRIRTVHLTRTDLAGFDITDQLQGEIVEGLEVRYDLPVRRKSSLCQGKNGYDYILPRHRGV